MKIIAPGLHDLGIRTDPSMQKYQNQQLTCPDHIPSSNDIRHRSNYSIKQETRTINHHNNTSQIRPPQTSHAPEIQTTNPPQQKQ
jgi:hypothetical protein